MRSTTRGRLLTGPSLPGLLSFCFVAVTAAGIVQAGDTKPTHRVDASFGHDTSKELRNVKPIAPEEFAALNKAEKRAPKRFRVSQEASAKDSAAQTTAVPLASVTSGLSFDGTGVPNYGVNAAPPDTNGSVGRTIAGTGYYIQWVNEAFSIYNKATGAKVYGPANGNTLWSGFGGQCETTNDGDPIVLYDKMADRWVFSQFAVTAQPYLQCMAVSKTSDPLGQYNRYSFSFGSNFNDYGKMGVWPDGYYMTYNMFANAQTFAGGEVCAMDRTAMLAGGAATQQCFNLGTSHGGMLASDLDGSILPAAGSPNYVMEFGTNLLNVWKLHVDWATPSASTLTGPTAIPVAAFGEACGGGTCIPQAGSRNKLDSLGDRLMYRLAYRKFADGHEALLVNHSVGQTRKSQTSVRWYEVRLPGGTPTLFQQGTYTPDSSYRWMGSVAMDKAGNIGMGYSVSSSGINPSIRFTGRGPSDPAGTMGAETNLFTGPGAQSGSLHRWGDYSSLSVDPDDDCTFWFTTEYLKTTGTFNWSTRIGSFKLNACQ